MNSVEQELIATALPYWEGEAAIVRRFFASKPSREDHIFWLKAQLWKELHPVDGYFTGLQKELNDFAARFSESGSSGAAGRTAVIERFLDKPPTRSRFT